MRLLEQDIITPALLQRFRLEGQYDDADGRHYALILRDGGDLLAHHPGSPNLDPVQTIWAGDALRLLNRELHHDGAWVVCFTHVQPQQLDSVLHNPGHASYGRYALIWLDNDGDPQFTVEWEAGNTSDLQGFADVMLCGIESTAQKCEAAWLMWHEHMRLSLDPREGEIFKRAKGEQAPSAVH